MKCYSHTASSSSVMANLMALSIVGKKQGQGHLVKNDYACTM